MFGVVIYIGRSRRLWWRVVILEVEKALFKCFCLLIFWEEARLTMHEMWRKVIVTWHWTLSTYYVVWKIRQKNRTRANLARPPRVLLFKLSLAKALSSDTSLELASFSKFCPALGYNFLEFIDKCVVFRFFPVDARYQFS